MKIIKRDGSSQSFQPNKILQRFKRASKGLKVNSDELAVIIISQIIDGITTEELDTLSIETAASKATSHPDYTILASRLYVTALRKGTSDLFSEAVKQLAEGSDLLHDDYIDFVAKHAHKLDAMIQQDRDYNHDYFGHKTLDRAYLLKNEDGKILERPQYMFMRTAIQVSAFNIKEVKETYDKLTEGFYTHATPTLFNSGTKRPQMSSCFLLELHDDSMGGIFKTLGDTAEISKWAGGIGLHIHNLRATGSYIKGTGGKSNGLIPFLRVFNETARYSDQGGGKRKGSFAMYLEPWHADVYDFLEMKKNHGKEEMRARDLFYAMWIPDLFMKRVKEDGDWYLFCPNKVLKATGKALQDVYGDEFEELYNQLVEDKLYDRKVKALDLYEKILISEMETGMPYIGYKDKVNQNSNQKNIGVIKSSNLCIEINEVSTKDEQAVCNLASIALPKFVNRDKKTFDYEGLRETTKFAAKKLDNVIDLNFYPTQETENSNNRHRPVGIGVQGLADVFAMLRIPFDSDEAKTINKLIFENMYFGALEGSMELAKVKGAYSTFEGSPASQGLLQFDLWGDAEITLPGWFKLKADIIKYGLRNSLSLAMMPTASTSQILGNNEAFEPFTSNMYLRRTLSGEFIVINKYLVEELEALGLWTPEVVNAIKRDNGSVQNLAIPQELKNIYKTAYELSMRHLIDMAADRQRFICQAQSMNLFMKNPTLGKLSSMHMYGWEKGLKTGLYYLRSSSAVDAKKVTVLAPESVVVEEVQEMMSDGDFECFGCGS